MKYFKLHRDGYAIPLGGFGELMKLVVDGKGPFARKGVDCYKQNDFLRQFCHNFDEVFTYYTTESSGEWPDKVFWREKHTYQKDWMLVDEYHRKINLEDFNQLSFEWKTPVKLESKRSQYFCLGGWEPSEKWQDIERKNPHLIVGNKGYFKGVQQERKLECDEMHKPFIRPKRMMGIDHIWGWMDEYGNKKYNRSWKNLKVKKQYQVRKKYKKKTVDF